MISIITERNLFLKRLFGPVQQKRHRMCRRNKCSARHLHLALIITTAELSERCSLRLMSMANKWQINDYTQLVLPLTDCHSGMCFGRLCTCSRSLAGAWLHGNEDLQQLVSVRPRWLAGSQRCLARGRLQL